MTSLDSARQEAARTLAVTAEPVEYVAGVGGSRLHYWVYHEDRAADGRPTVVCVHGFRGTHHGLELIVRGLPEYRVVVPDLPGFGSSTTMEEHRHDVEGYADALIQFLREQSTDPIVLCGHSFGSVIAARVAVLEPELVERLVLINPISTPALGGPRALLSRLAAAYYRLGRSLPERPAQALLTSNLIVRLISETMLRSRDPEVRRFVHKSHREHFSSFHGRAVLHQAFRASVSATVADYADHIAAPTLLVAGEADDIAPLPGQRAVLAQLRAGELLTIPDVGHLVHYETPQAAADGIAAFLASEPN